MIELQMTEEELLALPVAVDLITAGRAFGLGKTKSYELARAGDFPCRVLRVGGGYRVARRALLETLGIDPDADPKRRIRLGVDVDSDPLPAA